MTRDPLRFTAPHDGGAEPGCICSACRMARLAARPTPKSSVPVPRSPTPPAPGAGPAVHTPEDRQCIHTPEGGKPITTRED